MDCIRNIAEATGIVDFSRQAVYDHYHHQVTTGFNEADGAESTAMTISG